MKYLLKAIITHDRHESYEFGNEAWSWDPTTLVDSDNVQLAETLDENVILKDCNNIDEALKFSLELFHTILATYRVDPSYMKYHISKMDRDPIEYIRETRDLFEILINGMWDIFIKENPWWDFDNKYVLGEIDKKYGIENYYVRIMNDTDFCFIRHHEGKEDFELDPIFKIYTREEGCYIKMTVIPHEENDGIYTYNNYGYLYEW